MIRKYATATIIGHELIPANASRGQLRKAAHRVTFDYVPRPGYLYVRSRMISSRCNDNHDEFPAEEIMASWKTAVGKPAFVNHHNEDHRRMRGVIIDAALHEDTLPDGSPDIWIEALHEVDAIKFPKLAKAIIEGRVNRTSMGCDVGFSVCSACGNKASTPAEYCQHIPKMKGQILYKHTASGKREGHLIREICHKLSFFENSFLVEDPADPTAVVTGIDDRGLRATAAKTAALPNDMRFTYHEPDDYVPAHRVTVDFKAKNGRRVKGGHIWWDTEDGKVIHVNVPRKYQGSGIASALWQRAHEVSSSRGLPTPVHSDVQTPQGKQWAKSVDEKGLPPMPGPGQQKLFDIPPERETRINTSSLKKGAPFAGYEDFEECEDKNADKENPSAYCGEIKHRTEGRLKTLAEHQKSSLPGVTAAGPAHSDPAEHPFFKANPVSAENVINSFMRADDGRRAQGMRWYSDAHHLAGLIADGDHAKGAGVLAAYSPKAAWPDNMFNAARSLKEGTALGKGEGASIMGMHQKLAQKVMDGEHHSKVMKSPKISDFAHLIEHGDDTPEDKAAGKTRVVVDRHALSVATGRRMTTQDLQDAPLGSRHYYEHVAQTYRDAADHLTKHLGVEVKPHQVQAVTWGVQQEDNERMDEAAAQAHARGRATRTKNSWTRWIEHSKAEAPGLHEEPPNLHVRRPYEDQDEKKTGRKEVRASSLPSFRGGAW